MTRVSVFTPSHDPRFLDDAESSLLAQDFSDWEWIVLLNGEAEWFPKSSDGRIRVGRTSSTGVGALKSEACSVAAGDFLVELDHDDILLPTALTEIVQSFDENPDASLVYSDFVQVLEDGSPDPGRFNAAYGWTYDGDVCQSFLPYPSAVSYIWFGPNHVRAFRRSSYEAVGGYNVALDILDDQDLFCRLYQYGDFVHIPKSLYHQRVHDGNTQKRSDLNVRIQSETVQLYDAYVQGNALAWARRNGLACLDLGGAHNSPPGYLSVDLHDADIIGDVFNVLASMPDGSVGAIRASDFLEHIPDKVRLMNECHRVLAHGGMMFTMTPSSDGRGAYQDPTHVSFWNQNSFWYYTDTNFAKYVPEITCRFQVSRLHTYFPTDWHQTHNICYVVANLVAVKDGPRLPGELKI